MFLFVFHFIYTLQTTGSMFFGPKSKKWEKKPNCNISWTNYRGRFVNPSKWSQHESFYCKYIKESNFWQPEVLNFSSDFRKGLAKMGHKPQNNSWNICRREMVDRSKESIKVSKFKTYIEWRCKESQNFLYWYVFVLSIYPIDLTQSSCCKLGSLYVVSSG